MSGLKQAVLAVCVASAAIGALSMLTPSSRLEKSMRYLLSLLLLTLLAAPFAALPTVSFPVSSAAAETRRSDAELSIAQAQAEYLVRSILAEAGICPEKIAVFMDISPAGDIGISSIVVTGGADAEKTRSLLCAQLAVNEVEVKDE